MIRLPCNILTRYKIDKLLKFVCFFFQKKIDLPSIFEFFHYQCKMLVNVRMGSKANGSCRLIKTFNKSFMPVKSSIPRNTDNRTVGRIAIDRINRTLCQRFHVRLKKALHDSIILYSILFSMLFIIYWQNVTEKEQC